MKASLLELLGAHNAEVKRLCDDVRDAGSTRVESQILISRVKTAGQRWFDEVLPKLKSAGLDEPTLTAFSDHFSNILLLSTRRSTKAAYLKILQPAHKQYAASLIHPVETMSLGQGGGLNISPYLEGLSDDEKKYLEEAEKCAAISCLRASIVMGWCATIDRVHRKIEQIGFDKFSQSTAVMKNRTYGRFKPFNKVFSIDSLSELRREVFDTDLLWVLEFMELIDSNQHERLRHCFSLRNHSGHPGEAPITGENLYSFYSDITKIVLKNEKFRI